MLDAGEILDAAQRLEPLPASTARLASLLGEGDADFSEIVDVISFDPQLVAALLRSANSATSASRRGISTVHDAVIRLGTNSVMWFAMRMSAARRMGTAVPLYNLEGGALYEHSVKTSLACEVIRGVVGPSISASAVTSALLHDFGKQVLAEILPPRMLELLRAAAQADGAPTVEAEIAVLGMHHGEVAGLVCRQWRLPEDVIAGIAFHHPLDSETTPSVDAVALADELAEASSVDCEPTTEAHVYLKRLGIDPREYCAIAAEMLDRYDHLRQMG